MIIQTENLRKRYGKVRALDGLDLHVPAGSVYGFLGPNGAGKTTTLGILSGLRRADKGKAWMLGEAVRLDALGQRPQVGVLPEEPAFYPWMTPREYLRDFIAPLYRIERKQAAHRAGELLEQVGLQRAAERRIGGFSRGMRQRLGLAQALIHQPAVLLLDEPVSALDPAGRREVLEMIESLRGQCSIVLSTHILADVERVCDMIGIIDNGRMLLEERREDLLRRYVLPIFEIETEDGLGAWPEQARGIAFVEQVELDGRLARVHVREIESARQALLASLAGSGLAVRRFELVTPSLEDIFLHLTAPQTAKAEGGQA